MFKKNCVVTPRIAPQRKTRPTCEAMYGHRMNSPDERPTPAATTPGPTMRQRLVGGSGRSRTTGPLCVADCVARCTDESVMEWVRGDGCARNSIRNRGIHQAGSRGQGAFAAQGQVRTSSACQKPTADKETRSIACKEPQRRERGGAETPGVNRAPRAVAPALRAGRASPTTRRPWLAANHPCRLSGSQRSRR